jgi:hypothetical protein
MLRAARSSSHAFRCRRLHCDFRWIAVAEVVVVQDLLYGNLIFRILSSVRCLVAE